MTFRAKDFAIVFIAVIFDDLKRTCLRKLIQTPMKIATMELHPTAKK